MINDHFISPLKENLSPKEPKKKFKSERTELPDWMDDSFQSSFIVKNKITSSRGNQVFQNAKFLTSFGRTLISFQVSRSFDFSWLGSKCSCTILILKNVFNLFESVLFLSLSLFIQLVFKRYVGHSNTKFIEGFQMFFFSLRFTSETRFEKNLIKFNGGSWRFLPVEKERKEKLVRFFGPLTNSYNQINTMTT